MKHAPVYESPYILNVRDAEDRYRLNEAKVTFYQNYSFLEMMSIILIESVAYSLIIKFHQMTLLEIREKDHKLLARYLNGVLKFEPRKDIQKIIFQKLNVNYLQFINQHEDRKLYLKEIHNYVEA